MASRLDPFLDEAGRLTQWPAKQAAQALVHEYLIEKFDRKRVYDEAEINELLKQWHTFSDWPLLRRELVDHGFLDRDPAGSQYRRLR